MACDFNFTAERGLFKVTGSHKHYKSGNIMKTEQARDGVTTGH